MNDPWHDRHPEWVQRDADEIVRGQRTALLRLQLGLCFFGLIALAFVVIALRDTLPEGW